MPLTSFDIYLRLSLPKLLQVGETNIENECFSRPRLGGGKAGFEFSRLNGDESISESRAVVILTLKKILFFPRLLKKCFISDRCSLTWPQEESGVIKNTALNYKGHNISRSKPTMGF